MGEEELREREGERERERERDKRITPRLQLACLADRIINRDFHRYRAASAFRESRYITKANMSSVKLQPSSALSGG